MYPLKYRKKTFLVSRKHVIIFISFLGFSGLTIYYMYGENVSQTQPFIMNLNIVDNNIDCHYVIENDALPSAEDKDFIPGPNSIFFHETSCSKGLSSRQACAIESAARAHPERQVYVMFSAPVSEVMYNRSCIAKLRSSYNVKFARVHIIDYAKNTPLEAMVVSAPFNKSKWRVEHTSDVLRYLTLYKWGGMYLDTDMLVVKSLTPLGRNWVARESSGLVNAAAIAISMDELGRKLADDVTNKWRVEHTSDVLRYLTLYKWGGMYLDTDMLVVKCLTPLGRNWVAREDSGLVNAAAIAISMDDLGRKLADDVTNEVKTTYRPDIWIHNGPGAITRVLRRWCNTSEPKKWSNSTCQGLQVYAPEYIFPLYYSRNMEYFKPGELKTDKAYTHHLWNKITHNIKIAKDSPYEKMAKQFCPVTYEMYGKDFGT